MASCLPLQPTFKFLPVPAIAVFLIFFSGYQKKKKYIPWSKKTQNSKKRPSCMTELNTSTIWATSKKISGVTGISHGWLYINTMKYKRLLHLHPYKTPVVHEFYHSEMKQKWISWTANFGNFIPEKSTTHLFCLAIFMSH